MLYADCVHGFSNTLQTAAAFSTYPEAECNIRMDRQEEFHGTD